MILVVMVRTVHRIRFANQIRKLSQSLWTKIGIFGKVRGYVDVVLRRDFRSQSKFVKVLAREDWRIFELLDVGDRKMRGAAGSWHRICAVTNRSKRGADAPYGRDN